jgi:hypothetical protein
MVMITITITTPRGVIIGSGLRSVTTMGFGGTTCVISGQRSTYGVAVIRSVSGSSVAIAFADLRRSGDGIGTTKRGVGSG